jgi:hypothetical protein
MCKFNNHLFRFTVLISVSLLFGLVQGASLGDFLEELLDQTGLEPEQPDYDVYYDQRQNGTENYRLKIDGLVVAVPAEVDLDDEVASGPDDLSLLLTGLGLDSENLTNDDLYEILASIAAKKTATKPETISALNETVPEKPIEGEENATTLEVLRSPEPEVKFKKSKISGRKNFRVRLPGLFRKFVQPKNLN